MTAEQHVRIAAFRDGARVQIRVAGPLNSDTCPQLQQQVDAVLAETCSMLALDLDATEYVDSDGIRWLQGLQAELSDRDVELRMAVRDGSRVDRTLRLVQLDRTFPIERYPVEASDSDTVAAV
jgi:anti-anti-sigma factor